MSTIAPVRPLAAAVLLSLVACANIEAPATPAGPLPLAAGWQDHSRPLINRGFGLQVGTTAWLVPSLLPRGTYRVISRNGNDVRLIDGYRFEFDSGAAIKEVRLLLPSGYTNVEAVDEKYVLAAATATKP